MCPVVFWGTAMVLALTTSSSHFGGACLIVGVHVHVCSKIAGRNLSRRPYSLYCIYCMRPLLPRFVSLSNNALGQ